MPELLEYAVLENALFENSASFASARQSKSSLEDSLRIFLKQVAM